MKLGELIAIGRECKAWNTRPPTRDGAEGVGEACPYCYCAKTGLKKSCSAPPKPAPDAMRELLSYEENVEVEYIKQLVEQYEGNQELRMHRKRYQTLLAIISRVALSAPTSLQKAQTTAAVPTTDGTLATGILNSLEETAKYLRRADPATIDMDGVTQVLLAGVKQLRPFLSPSPAVAAEPVNVQPDYEAAARAPADRERIVVAPKPAS